MQWEPSCCVRRDGGTDAQDEANSPFAEYSQQDAAFHNLFISVGRSTCFRRVFRPSSGAQNCTYSVRPLLLPAASLARLAAGNSNGLTLYVQF